MKDGWLELNGEPALSKITLRGMLKEHSPGRAIGRGSTCLTPLPCPPHSPDLPHRTTLGRAFITGRVPAHGGRNFDDLRRAVEEGFNIIRLQILRHVSHIT